MEETKKNLYEGMYIISSQLSEDARQKAFEKVQSGITSRGGEVLKVHEWGRRRLAYDCGGHREGYYFILYFDVKPAAISEMWRDYLLHEDLVRFLTTRVDEVKETIEFKPLGEQK